MRARGGVLNEPRFREIIRQSRQEAREGRVTPLANIE
jgi:hypothetical protein